MKNIHPICAGKVGDAIAALKCGAEACRAGSKRKSVVFGNKLNRLVIS